MEVIDKVVRKMDFLIGISAEEIFLLSYLMDGKIQVDLNREDPVSIKAHDFFVNDFFKFIERLKEEAEVNGIRPDRS